MSQKKVVGRNITIALGLICIILAAALVGAVVEYNSTINSKDSLISSRDSQIQTLTASLDGNKTLLSQAQTWLYENETSLDQAQIWLDGNETALVQTQAWLDGNRSLLSQNVTLLKEWLDGNITYEGQLEVWLSENQTYQNTLLDSLNSNITAYNQLQSAYNSFQASHHYTDSQYDSLQSAYNDYVASHHHLDSEYDLTLSWLNANITYANQLNTWLEGNETYANQIENLSLSTVLVQSQTANQNHGAYSSWNFTAQYAGYVVVTVESSTTTLSYAEVIYSSHGVSYDTSSAYGGTGTGTKTFPLLPSLVVIRVGNTNYSNGATETVTITYYY